MQRFDGKTILVCGATSGIGLATARRLAKEGASIIALARNAERLKEVISELPGGGHEDLSCDAGDEAQVTAAGDTLKASGRVIHGAVLCAGRHSLRPLQLTKAVHIEELLAGNVLATLLCTKLSVRLAAREGASLVWVSSAAALIGNAGEFGYAAGKGALLAACRSLATELAPRHIRVNSVVPGVVETPMSEQWLSLLPADQKEAIRSRHLLGFGTPDDVASAITFLVSDDARWITGTSLTVDGGLTCH